MAFSSVVISGKDDGYQYDDDHPLDDCKGIRGSTHDSIYARLSWWLFPGGLLVGPFVACGVT